MREMKESEYAGAALKENIPERSQLDILSELVSIDSLRYERMLDMEEETDEL